MSNVTLKDIEKAFKSLESQFRANDPKVSKKNVLQTLRSCVYKLLDRVKSWKKQANFIEKLFTGAEAPERISKLGEKLLHEIRTRLTEMPMEKQVNSLVDRMVIDNSLGARVERGVKEIFKLLSSNSTVPVLFGITLLTQLPLIL